MRSSAPQTARFRLVSVKEDLRAYRLGFVHPLERQK
jgi:hypothetical protein